MKKIIIRMRIAIMVCVVALSTAGVTWSQVDKGTMPHIIDKDGRHALLVDGQPFFMLAGQAHNSSGWPGMMPNVWLAVETMHEVGRHLLGVFAEER